MKKLLIMLCTIGGVMLSNYSQGQDYSSDTKDKPAVEDGGVDPNTGMVNRPINPENRGDSVTVNNEEEQLKSPIKPGAKNYEDSISAPKEKTPMKTNRNKKQSKLPAPKKETEDPLSQGGLGTNASPNTVNTNTGMPSNATTPEEAK